MKPASTLFNLTEEEVPIYTCPTFDVAQMLKEDAQDEELGGKPYRFAKKFSVNISPDTDGQWETINDYKVWRYKMTSTNAYAMMVILEEFNLTSSTTLFVYNEDKSYIACPYTSQYNNEAQILPIRLIPGENLTIELIYHLSDAEIPNFTITSVSHDYKDILGFAEDKFEIGDLLECHNDINCPEGIAWQTEKRAVARIVIDGEGVCSGALVNTTEPSGTPLFLTANHCYDNAQQINSSVFYFNHESETCNEGDEGEENHIVEGAIPRANHPDTDFQLIELNARVPSSYRPFFAGWNREDYNRFSSVLIHHPQGHEKKIAITNAEHVINPLPIVDSEGNVFHNTSTVWEFTHTEGGNDFGSSGSPLFDVTSGTQLSRIIGQLSGGADFCRNYTTAGAFSVSWDAGGTQQTQLRNWLDINPANPNPTEMQGYFPAGWRYTEIGNVNLQGQGTNNKKIANGTFGFLKAIAVGAGNQVFYRGYDNEVQTIYFSSTTNSFQYGYLDQTGQNVGGDIVVGDGNQVFYQGTDEHLHTFYYSNGSWLKGQISNGNSQKIKNQCGSVAVGNGNQVFYRGRNDDRMRIYYWDIATSSWIHGYLGGSSAPNSEDVGGDIVVDKNNNNQVIYRGTDGKVHAYTYISGSWVHSILDPTSQVNSDCGSLTVDTNGNIFYKGINDDMIALVPNGSGGYTKQVLSNVDISHVSNIVGSAVSSNVLYRGEVDGKMRVVYGSGSGFGDDWIETSWQAPSLHSPNGAIAIGSNGEVFYRGDGDRFHRYQYDSNEFSKSSNNNDYFSMEETPLSPIIPKQENVGNILNVIVRPNPIQEDFSVDIYAAEKKEMAQIMIYDNIGRQVLFQETVLFEGRNTVELSLADYHGGMYYIKVMDKNGQHISKPILKQ